jgi:hypothetical protein
MATQTKGVADAAASLESDFLEAATRRRDEATKSPLDERHHEAMQLLVALAATVDQIEPKASVAESAITLPPVTPGSISCLSLDFCRTHRSDQKRLPSWSRSTRLRTANSI